MALHPLKKGLSFLTALGLGDRGGRMDRWGNAWAWIRGEDARVTLGRGVRIEGGGQCTGAADDGNTTLDEAEVVDPFPLAPAPLLLLLLTRLKKPRLGVLLVKIETSSPVPSFDGARVAGPTACVPDALMVSVFFLPKRPRRLTCGLPSCALSVFSPLVVRGTLRTDSATVVLMLIMDLFGLEKVFE